MILLWLFYQQWVKIWEMSLLLAKAVRRLLQASHEKEVLGGESFWREHIVWVWTWRCDFGESCALVYCSLQQPKSFKTLTHSAPGLNQRTIVGDVRSSEGASRAFRTCMGLGKVCAHSSATHRAVFPNTAAAPATTCGCQTDTRCSELCPDYFPSPIQDRQAKNSSCNISSSSVYIRNLAPTGCRMIKGTWRSWWNSDRQIFV